MASGSALENGWSHYQVADCRWGAPHGRLRVLNDGFIAPAPDRTVGCAVTEYSYAEIPEQVPPTTPRG